MPRPINEVVKVFAIFDPSLKGILSNMSPTSFTWRNNDHAIQEVTLHYSELIDGVTNHIYCIICSGFTAQLRFNTKTLIWFISQLEDSEEPA